MSASDFKHKDLPWVFAAGNGVQLMVWRSLAVSEKDPRYLPVADYIEEHGLLLVETERLPSDKHLYGRVQKSWFANAEARNLMYTFPEESNA